MGWERVAIALGAIAIAAVLLWLIVKAYGRLNRAQGGSQEYAKAHEADDKARKRFDKATSRPLSDDLATLIGRQSARAARRLGLRKPPAD